MENSTKTPEESSNERKQQIKKYIIRWSIIIAVVGILAWIGDRSSSSGDSSSSTTTGANATHKCTWCGKTYTGAGYSHIENECFSSDKSYDQCCSEKCCMDSWNSSHPH